MFARWIVGALALPFLILGAAAPALAQGEGDPAVPAEVDAAAPDAAAPVVHFLTWDDAITPVTRTVIQEAIEEVAESGGAALVIELDTPGGLLDATRDIVSDILDSPVPVLVWVGPAGARAASAGTFITMAAHVAAMAPGTNIGAASPVSMTGGEIDSTMASKMFNDTAAFVRTIAERRDRNAVWAEEAVRDAVSITENEAVELNVVDFVARDRDDLLAQAEGRVVEVLDDEITLAFEGTVYEETVIPLRYRILSILVNPNVVYILMMLGIYGLFFELQNPGAIFPGVIGAICIILALYSMQTLPLNLTGVLFLVLGGVLFLLEIKITSYGLLSLAGVGCTLLGGLMLFESPEPALRASLAVIVPITLVTAALFLVAVGLSVRTMKRPATTGREGLVGSVGTVLSNLEPRGQIDVHGEIWGAQATEGTDPALTTGEEVEVVAMDGLLLEVKRSGGTSRNS